MTGFAPGSRLPLLLLILGGLVALAPFTPAAAALVGGTLLALTLGNPWQTTTRAWTQRLLPLAVVGLGADMNLRAVAKAGLHGGMFLSDMLDVAAQANPRVDPSRLKHLQLWPPNRGFRVGLG